MAYPPRRSSRSSPALDALVTRQFRHQRAIGEDEPDFEAMNWRGYGTGADVERERRTTQLALAALNNQLSAEQRKASDPYGTVEKDITARADANRTMGLRRDFDATTDALETDRERRRAVGRAETRGQVAEHFGADPRVIGAERNNVLAGLETEAQVTERRTGDPRLAREMPMTRREQIQMLTKALDTINSDPLGELTGDRQAILDELRRLGALPAAAGAAARSPASARTLDTAPDDDPARPGRIDPQRPGDVALPRAPSDPLDDLLGVDQLPPGGRGDGRGSMSPGAFALPPDERREIVEGFTRVNGRPPTEAEIERVFLRNRSRLPSR